MEKSEQTNPPKFDNKFFGLMGFNAQNESMLINKDDNKLFLNVVGPNHNFTHLAYNPLFSQYPNSHLNSTNSQLGYLTSNFLANSMMSKPYFTNSPNNRLNIWPSQHCRNYDINKFNINPSISIVAPTQINPPFDPHYTIPSFYPTNLHLENQNNVFVERNFKRVKTTSDKRSLSFNNKQIINNKNVNKKKEGPLACKTTVNTNNANNYNNNNHSQDKMLLPYSPSGHVDCHVCPECGKRYSTSSNLARHRQSHKQQNPLPSGEQSVTKKCPHCEKTYVSIPAYNMHVRTHNQGCVCTHCGKKFSRPWLLQGHLRTHTGEKPFRCTQCSKTFADKSNLRAHIQTHSLEKPYICSRCNKAFALKSYLYKHEESSCMRSSKYFVGVA